MFDQRQNSQLPYPSLKSVLGWTSHLSLHLHRSGNSKGNFEGKGKMIAKGCHQEMVPIVQIAVDMYTECTMMFCLVRTHFARPKDETKGKI